MYKKISIILGSVMAVCFVGTLLCLPLGVRASIKQFNEILEKNEFIPTVVDINSDVISINGDWYYGYIEVKQSETDKAYMEIYNDGVLQPYTKWVVNYDKDNKAILSEERVYGGRKITREAIEKSLAREIQNYPDVIVYIPTTATIETENVYMLEDIEFKNKAELMEAQKQKEEAVAVEEQRRREDELRDREEEIWQMEEELNLKENELMQWQQELAQREEEIRWREENSDYEGADITTAHTNEVSIENNVVYPSERYGN